MSLNGLEEPAVAAAYQNALAEAGGWILLQYASRDELVLFGRGVGGVPELRSAIDGYIKPSPLYGFLQYRRRKIVINYMPLDLSRLIQARATVHFRSILDKFSPYDTVFAISQPSELTESTLSSACLLHAASGSVTSSSSSLRRRRLKEITEDAEENTQSDIETSGEPSNSSVLPKIESDLSGATVMSSDTAVRREKAQPAGGPQESPTKDDSSSSHRTDQVHLDPKGAYEGGSSRSMYEYRTSSQSTRLSMQELAQPQQNRKVKLGPRPSAGSSNRPCTSGSLSHTDRRPIAPLPAGIRSSPLRKLTSDGPRPQSQGNPVTSVPTRSLPPVPPLLLPSQSTSISRPPRSPGAKSLSAMPTMSPAGVSQERERLMKALKLRKKQLEKGSQGEGKQNADDAQYCAVLDTCENRENASQSHQGQQQQDDQIFTSTGKSKEPLSEVRACTILEATYPSKQANIASSDLSKPNSVVDVTISDSDGDQYSNSSPPSTAASPLSSYKVSPDISHVPSVSVTDLDSVREDYKAPVGNETTTSWGLASMDVLLENPSQEILETGDQLFERAATTTALDLHHKQPLTEIPNPAYVHGLLSHTSRLDPAAQSSTTPEANMAELQPDAPSSATLNKEERDVTEQREDIRYSLERAQTLMPEGSDDDNMSDDSLVAELRNATVEEAKPVSVGKPPPTSGVSCNENSCRPSGYWRNSRVISGPIAGSTSNVPVTCVARSSSGSYYSEFGGSSGSIMMAKKINVSSGISSRIKALEKFSSRDQPPNVNQPLALPPTSLEARQRRSPISSDSGIRSISASGRKSYIQEGSCRALVPGVEYAAPQLGIEGIRCPTAVSTGAQAACNLTDSSYDLTSGLSETRTPGLQSNSRLTGQATPEIHLDHVVTADSTSSSSEKRSMSISSSGSRRPSLVKIGRTDSRISVASRTHGEAVSPDEKKMSRTSRMIRRMSSITSSPRKAIMGTKGPTSKGPSETVQTERSRAHETHEATNAIDIGEVNIQFPGTLLWKRRFMRIDSKGYLTLAPGSIDSANRNMTKRYHMSEFATPCVPDEDEQELPNSILLDFLNGSTLQAACETKRGQEFVLRTLVDAYNAHRR